MTALAHYDAARRAIAEARSVDDVKDIIDRSEAKRAYARQIKDRTMETDAKEIRWRATRRLGEMIKAEKAVSGLAKGRRSDLLRDGKEVDAKPTLEEAGIDHKLSSLAQKYADMEETSFDRLVERCRAYAEHEDEFAPVDVLRHDIKEKKRAADAEAFAERTAVGCNVTDLTMLAESGQDFRTIYADPPWEFRVYSGAGKDWSADRHYKTGGLDSIKSLPVQALAAKDCALFMWCVMPELQGALDVIKAWGFEYKTVAFTWVKQNKSGEGLFWGMGYWTRANAEICLLATRGNPDRLDKGVHQVLLSPIQEHSRKPEEIRKRIERLIGGPRLELYARRECEGWTTWGNEIPRSSFPVDEHGEAVDHDADTGEIIERTEASPSSEPSSPVVPQSEAGHADTGRETSAGCEADTAGEGANALADLSPPESTSSCLDIEVREEDGPHYIPPFLRRESVPVASVTRVESQLDQRGGGG